MTMDNAASAHQPFASFLMSFWGGDVKYRSRCSRLMDAGWESLPGWRAGKSKAGQDDNYDPFSIKDEPLILLPTLLLPMASSGCL